VWFLSAPIVTTYRQKLRTALYLYLNCSFRPAGHSSPTASPVSSTYEQTLLYRTVSLYGCPTRRCFRTISNDLIDLTRYVTGPGQKSGLQEFGASITISITITDSLRPLNGPSRQQPALLHTAQASAAAAGAYRTATAHSPLTPEQPSFPPSCHRCFSAIALLPLDSLQSGNSSLRGTVRKPPIVSHGVARLC